MNHLHNCFLAIFCDERARDCKLDGYGRARATAKATAGPFDKLRAVASTTLHFAQDDKFLGLIVD
jgi:hypothetical protein